MNKTPQRTVLQPLEHLYFRFPDIGRQTYLNKVFQVLSKGSFRKIQQPFSQGVQKEEIQQ